MMWLQANRDEATKNEDGSVKEGKCQRYIQSENENAKIQKVTIGCGKEESKNTYFIFIKFSSHSFNPFWKGMRELKEEVDKYDTNQYTCHQVLGQNHLNFRFHKNDEKSLAVRFLNLLDKYESLPRDMYDDICLSLKLPNLKEMEEKEEKKSFIAQAAAGAIFKEKVGVDVGRLIGKFSIIKNSTPLALVCLNKETAQAGRKAKKEIEAMQLKKRKF